MQFVNALVLAPHIQKYNAQHMSAVIVSFSGNGNEQINNANFHGDLHSNRLTKSSAHNLRT